MLVDILWYILQMAGQYRFVVIEWYSYKVLKERLISEFPQSYKYLAALMLDYYLGYIG